MQLTSSVLFTPFARTVRICLRRAEDVPYHFPPMFRRHRARRGPYAMAAPSVVPSVIRSLVLLLMLGLLLYGTAKFVFWVFGGAGSEQTAATLTVEQGGIVSVAVEDGLLQRVEDSLKVYPGDRVVSGASGNAQLRFFDVSTVRMDGGTEFTVAKDMEDMEESEWQLTAAKGSLWVRTPTLQTYSGVIVRTIVMPLYSVELTSDTEAVLEESQILVFNADGQGVKVTIDGVAETIIIGEGQQYKLPEGEIGSDPYKYRSAIEPLAAQRTFIMESRALSAMRPTAPVVSGSGQIVDTEPLVVTAPSDSATITTPTVRVEGRVSSLIERVRVNGYDAVMNRAAGTFAQELSLQDAKETTLKIEALDARGLVLAQESRTVFRGSQTIATPVIAAPAGNGQTYRTQKDEITVSGTVPAGTEGVIVNDYRLQLFRSGDTTWSYLASKALGNMKDGVNIYDIVALDKAGNRSAPVRITINVEAGAEGVIGGGATTSSAAPVVQESNLPTNDPLMPGAISITGPAAGTSYTATGSEFLLEGTTPKETTSVWVNGYKLQLYKPGATFWNYIAKTEYNTLKPGTNVYRIIARNAEDKILDRFEYTVTYNP